MKKSDPIVEEVHQARRKIVESCDNDIDTLLEYIQRQERARRLLNRRTCTPPDAR